jgi:hypothetical protein
MKFLRIRLVLAHQLDGDREGARHILIVGFLHLIAVQLIVDGAGPEHLRLQRNADGNLFFLAHGCYPHLIARMDLILREVALESACRRGGAHPTTFSARRQASAWGAGCGGS